MWLKRKQKKNRFFGTAIPASCNYCAHNSGKDSLVVCSQRREMKNGKCKKYQYNPLMREPRQKMGLKTENFSKEDFEL